MDNNTYIIINNNYRYLLCYLYEKNTYCKDLIFTLLDESSTILIYIDKSTMISYILFIYKFTH